MKPSFHIEIYKDKKKEFRWRIKAKNGEVVPDGYTTKAMLKKTLTKLTTMIQKEGIVVEDLT